MGTIYRREGSANWWLRYTDASGKRVRRSAGTTNKGVALTRLAEIEAAVADELATKSGAAVEPPSTAIPDMSLEQRVESLERVVRRLLAEKVNEVRFLRAWARSSERLISD